MLIVKGVCACTHLSLHTLLREPMHYEMGKVKKTQTGKEVGSTLPPIRIYTHEGKLEWLRQKKKWGM